MLQVECKGTEGSVIRSLTPFRSFATSVPSCRAKTQTFPITTQITWFVTGLVFTKFVKSKEENKRMVGKVNRES